MGKTKYEITLPNGEKNSVSLHGTHLDNLQIIALLIQNEYGIDPFGCKVQKVGGKRK